MVKRIIFLLVLFGFAWVTFAQTFPNKDLESKIDSMFVKPPKIMDRQQKLQEFREDKPLANKFVGVEINPVRLFWLNEGIGAIAGTVSLFAINRSAEIAFPFFVGDPADPVEVDWVTVDCHYRYFLGEYQQGFYISAFTRYAHLEGLQKGWQSDGQVSQPRTSENKLGIGCGVGWRHFSHEGAYWGTSFSIGRYLKGNNDCFKSNGRIDGDDLIFFINDNDNKFIYDFEFLKFGWAF